MHLPVAKWEVDVDTLDKGVCLYKHSTLMEACKYHNSHLCKGWSSAI